VCLERGPLNLVITTEELLEWKSSGSGLENREQWPWGSVALTSRHPLSAKLALSSPTFGGLSVGIVRLRTKATEFKTFLMHVIYGEDNLTEQKPCKLNLISDIATSVPHSMSKIEFSNSAFMTSCCASLYDNDISSKIY
jgi:hypothetical protein